jgi:hypothetical protein
VKSYNNSPFQQTLIPIKKTTTNWQYHQGLTSVGSCFADNVSGELSDLALAITANPAGTLYNPLSIAHILQLAAQNNYQAKLFEHRSLWRDLNFHSSLASPQKENSLKNISQALQTLQNGLENSSLLLITLGSAWGYFHKSDLSIAANCHQLPAKDFIRRQISIAEGVQALKKALVYWQEKNPSLQIIFSLSPIRHLADKASENSLSKALLRVMIDELCRELPLSSYFPAWEIMMDELRDYRFYNDDMIHPSNLAITYITQQFLEVYASPEMQQYIEKAQKIRNMRYHKTMHPHTTEHQKFLQTMRNKINHLAQEYPLRQREIRQWLSPIEN